MSTHLNAHCWFSVFLGVTRVFQHRLQWNALFHVKADKTALLSQTCDTKQWSSLSFHRGKLDIAISRSERAHTGLVDVRQQRLSKRRFYFPALAFLQGITGPPQQSVLEQCCKRLEIKLKLINRISENPGNSALWRWGVGELDLGCCELVEWTYFYVLKLEI